MADITLRNLLAAMPAGVIERIRSQADMARLFGAVAFAAALVSVTLFFALRIPHCIRALTGLGRRREIARMSRKTKRRDEAASVGGSPALPPAGHPIMTSDASWRARPMPDGIVIERELP